MTGKVVRLLPKQMLLNDFISRTLQGMSRQNGISLTEAWDLLVGDAYTNANFEMNGLTESAINIGRLNVDATMETKVIVPPGATLETAKPASVSRSWNETVEMLEKIRNDSVMSIGLF